MQLHQAYIDDIQIAPYKNLGFICNFAFTDEVRLR